MASVSSSRASAPGTLMILGEHAVLHGRRALACAVDRRITVTATTRTDDHIRITSALGSQDTRRDALPEAGPLRFVNAVLRRRARTGLDITIESDFSATVGLGSSAAVTVAMTAALHALAGNEPAPEDLHREACEGIRSVQGLGSGTDVAASVLGGIVAYRQQPRELRRLSGAPPIVLIYCGFKTPTVEVVRGVEARREQEPERFSALFDRIDASVPAAEAALRMQDWPRLGAVLDDNQATMREMGVSNDALDDILQRLQGLDTVHGAKISGSGLGDCVLGIGSIDPGDVPYEVIPVAISPEGVRID